MLNRQSGDVFLVVCFTVDGHAMTVLKYVPYRINPSFPAVQLLALAV